MLGIIRAGEIDPPSLGWATGSEGVLLRWRWPHSWRQPDYYRVYRDGALLSEVRRVTDEEEAIAILGEDWKWIQNNYGEDYKIASIADLHRFLDKDNPVAEQWLANERYSVALVRGTGYLDGEVREGDTHKYGVVAILPGGGEKNVGEVEITHEKITPLPAPEGLKVVTVVNDSLRGSDDWAESQKNRKAHCKVFLYWDLIEGEKTPEFWIAGYDVFRADDPRGPYQRINTEIVIPMPNYMPPGESESEYKDYDFDYYFVDDDPNLQYCQEYYYQIAPRDLLGQPGEKFSNSVKAVPPDTMPPSPPQNLEVSENHLTGEITLSWSSVEDAAKYHVYRSTTPKAGWLVGSSPGWENITPDVDSDGITATSWVDNTGVYEQDYWYVVRAEDAPCGTNPPNLSAPSQPAHAILHDRVPPGKPSAEVDPKEFPGIIRVCLNDPITDDDTTHFLVYASFDSGNEFFFWREIKRGEGMNCIDDFKPEAYYQPPLPVEVIFRFAAIDAHGNMSVLSDPVRLCMGPSEADPPPQPIIINIDTREGGGFGWTAQITWEAQEAPGLTGFRIYRYITQDGTPDPTTKTLIADEGTLGPDKRTFGDNQVEPNYIYAYEVAAYRKAMPLYGPEKEVPSEVYLYKVVPPLETCTRPVEKICWNTLSQFSPDAGTDLIWNLPPRYAEFPYCVVFRSLRKDDGYVQITPPIKDERYIDESARHPNYWYVVMQLDFQIVKTGELVGSGEPVAVSDPWRPSGSAPSTFAIIDARPSEGAGPGPGDYTGPYPDSKTTELPPSADATVDLANPDQNYGKEKVLGIYQSINDLGRALVSFDLSGIPQNAVIDSAFFSAYARTSSGGEIDLVEVLDPWKESEVNWLNKPSALDVIATTNVDKPGQRYRWDITDQVRKWWHMGYPNYGFEMRGSKGGKNYEFYFISREGEERDRPVLAVSYTLLPEQLQFGDGYKVGVKRYYSGSTLDSLSGCGTLTLGGGVLSTYIVDVDFTNVTADSYGKVLNGEIQPSISIDADYPDGFDYHISDLVVDENWGVGQIRLSLPDGITAYYTGVLEEPLPLQVQIHPDLSFDGVFDVTSLPDQDCTAKTPSFYFELDPLPLRVVPLAKVVFTEKSIEFDSTCTQYEERYTDTRPARGADASDGYLRVSYQSKGKVGIYSDGLKGDFATEKLVEYITAIPYGFAISAGGVSFSLEKSTIVSGEMRDGNISFSYYQVPPPSLPSLSPLLPTGSTGYFKGEFETLKIGTGGSLYGLIETSDILEWAKPLGLKAGFSLNEPQYELYIPPVETQDMPWEDAWSNWEKDAKIQSGINRVTKAGESVDFLWRHCELRTEATFPEGVEADIYARRGGVSDFITAKISLGSSVNAEIYGYTFEVTSFRLTFCDNFIHDSDVAGNLILPFPADLTIPLVNMKVDSNTACLEGGIVRKDADPLITAYWQARLHPDAVEFRKETGLPPADNPRWTRALWILGTTDVPHVAPPGKTEVAAIPLETSFKPNGTFHAFKLSYNEVYYGFDGFSFFLEEMRLSDWDATTPETLGWDTNANLEGPPACCDNYGFIELDGNIVVPYFGTLVAEGSNKTPSIYVLASKYLFNVDDDTGTIESGLNNKNIPTGLEDAFDANGFALSGDASVAKRKNGTEWVITDNEESFVVEKDDGELDIYQWNKYVGFSKRPKAKRSWTVFTWDFDLLYAHHHTEHQGVFVGFGGNNLKVFDLAQAVVIGPNPDPSIEGITTSIYFGISSGSIALKALAETTQKDLPLDNLSSELENTMTNKWIAKPGMSQRVDTA